MGLLRTPPQKVHPSAHTPRSQARAPSPGPSRSPIPPAVSEAQAELVPSPRPLAANDAEPGPSEDVGNVTTISVTSSHAFVPRKPNVVRSPPGGSSMYPSLPATIPAAGISVQDDGAGGNDDEISMEIDDPSSSTQRQRTSSPTRQAAVFPTTTPDSRPIRPARAAAAPSAPALPELPQATTTPPVPVRTQSKAPRSSRGSVRRANSVAEPDISATSEAAESSVQDTTLSSIPPPLDSPPRQVVHDTAAFVTPKPDRAPMTPGTKRKAPADDVEGEGQSDPTAFSRKQFTAQESGDATAGVDYGRRWKMSNDTLKLVTERVVKKWTAEDLKKSLPTLAQQDPRGIESIHRAAAHNLQANIMVRARRHDEPIKADEQSKAQTLFEHYRMGRSLQSIDRVVAEGDAYETTRTSDNARPDAWRSDLSPEALTAAMNLQMYDEAWTRLRTEYIELHEDSRRRYASIVAKQAQLKELEGSVSDGVVELDKTIQLLNGFPDEEMMAWMEDTVGRVGGARDA